MIPMTLQEAADNTAGLVLGDIQNQKIMFSDIATDTRQSMSDSLFIALKGEHFNAHEFINKAINQGAVACMLDENRETSLPVLKVDNTLKAMGQLAKSVRAKMAIKCIGITGSCGKTTVKEMVASILSVKGKVLATKGNFNNAIGVPLTLFRLTSDDQFAVIEMGASKPGDIDEIAQLVAPDVALITNVAAAHLQGLGSIEGVAKVKGEILGHLQAGGTAIVEHKSPWLTQWKIQLADKQKLSTFSATDTDADFHASNISKEKQVAFVAVTPIGEIDIQLPIPGMHNINNALAAMAAAIAVGASLEDCQKGLAGVGEVKGRLQITKGLKGCRIIDDSYNANPASLKVAMQLLSEFAGNKVLVLGDMAELGDGAASAHLQAGEQAKALGIDAIYATGKLSHHSVGGFGEGAEYFETKALLAEALSELLTTAVDSQWTVLVKGSRSAAMEEIVELLQAGTQICY